MIEDAELLRRYADDRSEPAFAELVQRHVNVVYAAALRRVAGDAHLAEEISQTVFTTLARKAGSLAEHPVLVGWLHRSTHFAALDAVRDKARRERREQPIETMNAKAETNPHRDAEIDWEEIRPVVDSLLDQLNERDRGALLLRFFEGHSFSQIGATLRLTEDAARMRVERALDKLRAALTRRGISSTSAALGLALANQAAATAPTGIAASITGGALAGATASSVGWLAAFMSTTQFATSAAAILAMLAIGTAGYQLHAQRESEDSLASARQNYDAHHSRLQSVEQHVRVAEQSAAELQKAIEASKARVAAEAAAKAWNPAAEGNAFLQRHPELRQAMRDNVDSYWNIRFARLFKAHGFTPEQTEEFRALVRGNNSGGRWDATVDGKKVELALAEQGTISNDEFRNRLSALVGEEGLTEYLKYLRPPHWEAMRATIRLSNDLCLTETPLTSAQADQLIEKLYSGFADAGWKTNYVNAKNVNWNGIEAGARQILSEAQLPAWESAFRRSRAQMGVTEATAGGK